MDKDINSILNLHIAATELMVELLPEIINDTEKSVLVLHEKFNYLANKATGQADIINKVVEVANSLMVQSEFVGTGNIPVVIKYLEEMSSQIEAINLINDSKVSTLSEEQLNLLEVKSQKLIEEVNQGYEKDHKGDVQACSKEIERLLYLVFKQNSGFSALLQESANTSKNIAESISKIIINMQFQDRIAQQISCSLELMKIINQSLLTINNPKIKDIDMVLAKSMAESIRMADIKNRFANKLVTKGNLSDISMLIPQNDKNLSDMLDDDELF